MNTQQRIELIDSIGNALALAMKVPGMKSLLVLPSHDELSEIPVDQFVEICEHYKTEPTGIDYPSVWLKVGGVEINVKCERLREEKPRKSAMEALREICDAKRMERAAA